MKGKLASVKKMEKDLIKDYLGVRGEERNEEMAIALERGQYPLCDHVTSATG